MPNTPQKLQMLRNYGYQTVCEKYSTKVVSGILEQSTKAVVRDVCEFN